MFTDQATTINIHLQMTMTLILYMVVSFSSTQRDIATNGNRKRAPASGRRLAGRAAANFSSHTSHCVGARLGATLRRASRGEFLVTPVTPATL
jgi:hypothetical protein